MSLATRISAHRIMQGLTQAKAALLAGISERQWRRYERGEASPPVKTLERMSDVLAVEATVLLRHPRPK